MAWTDRCARQAPECTTRNGCLANRICGTDLLSSNRAALATAGVDLDTFRAQTAPQLLTMLHQR